MFKFAGLALATAALSATAKAVVEVDLGPQRASQDPAQPAQGPVPSTEVPHI